MTNRHTTDEMMGMTSEVHRQRAARISRATMGERLGGFIYGTIVALAVVVAGARAYPQGAGHIAALVAATSVAFWLAHVYSLARAERLGPLGTLAVVAGNVSLGVLLVGLKLIVSH